MDNGQQHIAKVKEALHLIATTSGNKRYDAQMRLNDSAEGWLETSIELLEQQQREIDGLKKKLQASRDSVYGISVEGDEARCELNEAKAEIERLRQRSQKLHETLNTYWQGDCDKATVIKAQSGLCAALSPKEEQTDG